MPIKLIATDLDGTFLNAQRVYDKPRFLRVLDRLKAGGIHFVPTTGNQIYRVRSYFREVSREIGYIAENGALVMDGMRLIFAAAVPDEAAQHMYAWLKSRPDMQAVVCGRRSAYVLDSEPDDFYNHMINFYKRLQRVRHFDEVDDQLFKFALTMRPDQVPGVKLELDSYLEGQLVPVIPVPTMIDINLPGVNKGTALERYCSKMGIVPEECVGFGDNFNDLEMLRFVGHPWSMANAPEAIRAEFPNVAPSNNESGVLEVIEKLVG